MRKSVSPPGRGRRSWWASPYARFGLISLGLIAVVVGVVAVLAPGFVWWGLLLAVNVITLMVYRYDKAVAGGGQMRVPEIILWLLAAVGGSPAAYGAMFVIRPPHKNRKGSFQLVYWAIVAVQVVLVVGWRVYG